jgi:hypothetical protein
MVYDINKYVILWFYVKQTLLWISVAENINCGTNFRENLSRSFKIILSNGLDADTRSQTDGRRNITFEKSAQRPPTQTFIKISPTGLEVGYEMTRKENFLFSYHKNHKPYEESVLDVKCVFHFLYSGGLKHFSL